MRNLASHVMPALAGLAMAGAAHAAPYAVLYFDPDGIAAVDVASVRREGSLVRYETVSIQRPPAELAQAGVPDELHHWKETDCGEPRTRLVRMAMLTEKGLETPSWAETEQEWTEVDPAEQRLLCVQAPADATFPTVKALRDALSAKAGRRR